MYCRDEAFEILQEEGRPMRSLSELAENYERWAAQDESIVTGIMNKADGFPQEVRGEQLRHASLLSAEAQSFRHGNRQTEGEK